MSTEINIRHTEWFNELSCVEGHYITNYKEGDDISTFNASKLMVCPLSVDIVQYYCITDEEYNRFLEKKKAAMSERNNVIPELSIIENKQKN